MDSFKIYKGYGKVSHLEDQSPPQNPTRKYPITTVAISAILLLTLFIGFAVAAVIHETNKESPEPESPALTSSNSAESIKTVCHVTPHPDSCFISITSSLNNTPTTKPVPEAIFKLSLLVTIKELKALYSSFKTLNDLHSELALGDCMSQMDDALSRINDSVRWMEVGPQEKVLTKEKMNDIQTWISGAMTDQETCFDGLEEMGSTVLDQVKAMMQRSKEYMSNSLAIVAKMQTLLDKFGLMLH